VIIHQIKADDTGCVLPAEKGTYILILHLDIETRLTIGQMGLYNFSAGWYAYVGSAFGPGGLRARLRHHLTPVKKPHWHIDYLRITASIQTIWYMISAQIWEHRWAQTLRLLPDATTPVPRFGASDCRCPTHLIGFPVPPDFVRFSADAHTSSQASSSASS
jgi:Uri superfamily endonuclease